MGTSAANDNWPLVLRRQEAAEMCKISVQTFDIWVRKGILSGPIKSTRRWSRVSVEGALSGGQVAPPSESDQSAFEQWKNRNAH